LKRCCVLQDHYDDERDKTVFHNTTADLQDQDQDWLFWSQTAVLFWDGRSQTTSLMRQRAM